MWEDFSHFIVNILLSIISVITIIYYLLLQNKYKNYNTKEYKRNILLFIISLIFILIFIIFFMNIYYKINLFNSVLNIFK